MKINSKLAQVGLATAAALMMPSAAIAQDTATTDATYGEPVEREDDNDFPWGLLGLLGLAGLLGRKKRDNDVHVDARRDTRP